MITITTANTPGQLWAVQRLTYRAYLAVELCQKNPNQRLEHYPHLDNIAETTVVTAMAGGRLVGTVSIPAYRGDRRLIMLLMRAGFEEAIARKAELLVCSFHPRRQKVHERLGFSTLAWSNCRALNGARSVLMMYDVGLKGIPEQLRREEKLLIHAHDP